MGPHARPRRSSAARCPFLSGKAIRRTTYWAFGKPVSLAYIPALADEHPEATIISHEPPTPARPDYELPSERRAPRIDLD